MSLDKLVQSQFLFSRRSVSFAGPGIKENRGFISSVIPLCWEQVQLVLIVNVTTPGINKYQGYMPSAGIRGQK